MTELEQALEHHQAGQLPQAEALYRQILSAEPDHPDALHLLGVIALQARNYEAAVDLIRRAIAVNPEAPIYHSNLGEALRALERLDEAITAYHQALALKPDYAEAHNNLGNALAGQGRLAEAVTAFQQALALKPDYAEAYNNLGTVLRSQDSVIEAISAYRQALVLKPDFAEAHYNLGNALREQGKLADAFTSYQKALAIRPDYAEAYNNLGFVLKGQGKLADAIACFRQALALKPDFAVAHSNLFFCMHYTTAYDAEAIFTEARTWNERHARPLATYIRAHDNDRSPQRRLRIGYVSADFTQHPVGFFFLAVVAAHERNEFEVICYSGVLRPDAITKRLAEQADHWREIARIDDDALAALIRADRIDILVDLAGHSADNRLLAFARKPAPVQVTGGGHYDTTGLDMIDYLLSDRFHTPPGTERYFSEELVRLPHGYVCYTAPDYAPAVTELPALHQGYVTFGCFNNLAKVTPDVVQLWAKILQALPNARIKLQTRGLNDTPTRDRYRALCQSHGIDRSRLELAGAVPHQVLLANYNTIDIALDPFPYSGGLTTCEALWMGVPVITLTGSTFAGRHSTSHLSNVGLMQFITTTPQQYVAVAIDLARDVDRLAEIRRGLRGQMASSPLCDAERYTRDLEAAYRQMWRRWCESSYK